MQKNFLLTTVFSLASISILPMSTSSIAADKSFELEEIVVTARKRGAQALQDIPSSIQAIGSESMQRQQIQSFDDYARLVPSLAALNSGPGQTQIIIRGVSASRIAHSNPQNKSTTGIYIDEMPVTANAFNPDLALFDVDRIEVLRGPQGTLYGAGAMAGAIRVITKQPNFDALEAMVDGTLSSTSGGGENYAIRGMVNIPVSENSAVRVSGYYQDNSGFIDNVYSGEEDYNSDQTKGFRVGFKVQPSEALTLTFNGMYQDLHADGRSDEFLPGKAVANRGGDVDIQDASETAAQFTVTDGLQVVKRTEDPFDDEFYILNFTLDYDMDWAILTSSSSYFDRQFDNTLDDIFRSRAALGFTSDFTFTQPSTAVFTNESEIQDFAQEVRLASNSEEGEISWIFGLYYQKQDRSFDQAANVTDLEALWDTFVVPSGLPTLASFGASGDNLFEGMQTINQRQFAAFGEFSFPIGEKIEFTLGVRAFDWKQDTFIDFAGLANSGPRIIDTSTSENGINPKFQLAYNASDDVLVYATAAKGFRLGGVNDPIPSGTDSPFGEDCAADLIALGVTELPESFESDSLWNYEVGAKTKWMDNRVTVNAAAYHIVWSNIQNLAFLPCGFQTVVNAGEVRSQGVELEVNAAVTESLNISFGGSFTDSTLTEEGLALNAAVGDRIPNVPKWLLNAAFDYSRPLGSSDRELFVRGDIQHTSNSFSEFNSVVSAIEVPSHTSANVVVGLQTELWDISLFVKNIWDERIIAGVDTDRNIPASFTRARPRTFGINARVRFQ